MTTSDQNQIAQWVEELKTPRMRRAARRNLVRVSAVDALLECLDSPNESVVWAAIESLQELKAKEAVEPLLALLGRGVLVSDTIDALVTITGQNFGFYVQKWIAWGKSTGQIKGDVGSGAAVTFDLSEMIEQTADLLGSEAEEIRGGYKFRVSLADNRSQSVTVQVYKTKSSGRLLVIYSECGPADKKYYEALLRKNLTLPVGAFAIRDIDEKPTAVMVDTMLPESVLPGTLARKIEMLAKFADSAEEGLTGEDVR